MPVLTAKAWAAFVLLDKNKAAGITCYQDVVFI